MRDVPSVRRVTVVIVDDHPIFRRGLADLIGGDPQLSLRGEAATVAEGLSLVANATPDVAIVDLSLGTESGLDLVKAIAAAHPRVRILVLSGYDERLYAGRALEAGAHGYIMKDQAGSELLAAVRRVALGRTYVSAESAERILSTMSRRRLPEADATSASLTDREQHVLALVAQGLATSEIAAALSISVKTVESHYAHMKEKLGLRSVRELTLFAARLGDGGRS